MIAVEAEVAAEAEAVAVVEAEVVVGAAHTAATGEQHQADSVGRRLYVNEDTDEG